MYVDIYLKKKKHTNKKMTRLMKQTVDINVAGVSRYSRCKG